MTEYTRSEATEVGIRNAFILAGIDPSRADDAIARVRRAAAREALDGLAEHSDSRDGDGVRGRLGGIIRIWRDTHYPEEPTR